VSRVLVALVRLYQLTLSPYLGNHCRFTPSCSRYAIEALQTHGAVIGTGYTIWRLLRCQPFCKGGADPVPPRWRLFGGHGAERQTRA
jgi:putative membrane protein insertion efficiency factor